MLLVIQKRAEVGNKFLELKSRAVWIIAMAQGVQLSVIFRQSSLKESKKKQTLVELQKKRVSESKWSQYKRHLRLSEGEFGFLSFSICLVVVVATGKERKLPAIAGKIGKNVL